MISPNSKFSKVTPEIKALSKLCTGNGYIKPELYLKYKVNRGLRDLNGKGVLTGLTEISDIKSKEIVGDKEIPCEGELYYRGISIDDIVNGFSSDNRFGFEEVTYLLLFGELPDKESLIDFETLLSNCRTLPPSFVRDIIMKAPSVDLMNTMSRCVLTLYSYDEKADDISIPNVLRQCLQLIAIFPMLAVYAYHVSKHYNEKKSLIIHSPEESKSTAENILHMLRPNMEYTELEAKVLDLALVLHAEHGGGNNSTFTTHVVSSSGTDTYSSIAASLGSLKGPKHGGANIKVVQMFEDMKKKVNDWNDDDEVKNYLNNLLNKKAFDKAGLIYGMGHAIYSLSDPRANIFKEYVQDLSEEKGLSDEYKLYDKVATLAPEIIAEKRKMYKGVSPNIDFYSGFVYGMLDLPIELYTPIFAVARVSGWSAHRIEELVNAGKIIRPAYKNVHSVREYIDLKHR